MMTNFDMQVAARTLCQEARGESPDAQAAVAWTIRNRLSSGRWGGSLASVCLWNAHIPSGGQGFQFSGWRGQDSNFTYVCNLRDEDPILGRMRGLIAQVMDAQPDADPTAQATHYYNPDLVAEPLWVKGDPARGVPPATPCGKFGHQLFFKNVR
jgi:spore germination cell wall hydrolase CwlJ-like protein